MEDDIGLGFLHGFVQFFPVADVGDDRPHLVGDAGQFVEIRLSRRPQGITGDLRSHIRQPQGKPGAFETGMARHEDLSAPPKITVQSVHTFQGALPLCQYFSNATLSRNVSIGCQKPRCL